MKTKQKVVSFAITAPLILRIRKTLTYRWSSYYTVLRPFTPLWFQVSLYERKKMRKLRLFEIRLPFLLIHSMD